MEKQLQRVTEGQAKKLFDAGFDWECNHFYNKKGELKYSERTDSSFSYLSVARVNAPTVALALMWFRSVHKLVSEVRIYSDCVYCFDLHKNGILLHHSLLSFKTYELAESASLDELLNLIKTKNV